MPAHSSLQIDEPVHILLGASAAGTIRGCTTIVLTDNLAWGPADPDPVRHGEKRKAFWRDWLLEGPWSVTAWERRKWLNAVATEITSSAELATAIAAYPENRPLLLWTAASWKERLSFWWALDAICQTGLPRERFWVAQPQLTQYAEPSLGCFCREQLEAAFACRTPLDHGLLRSGATLWRKYAASSPRAFDAARQRGVRRFPDLTSLGKVHSCFFPRVTPTSTQVQLSHLDQLLFDHLHTDEWVRPHALLQDRYVFDDWLMDFGDQTILERLHEWSAHRPGNPALLSRQERGAGDWTNIAYRLTQHGGQIRSEGLGQVDEAPTMFVGGCCVYSGRKPWVRWTNGDSWQIVRLNP